MTSSLWIAFVFAMSAVSLGCVEPELVVDGKYSCLSSELCPDGFLCIAGLCRDGFPHASQACGTCAAEHCAQELAACTDDDGCRELYACVAGCVPGDPTCRDNCVSTQPQAASSDVFESLNACRRTACLGTCIGLGGMYAPIGASCDECVQERCRELLVDCLGLDEDGFRSGDCDSYHWCTQGGVRSPANLTVCEVQLPRPSTHQHLYWCAKNNCPLECGFSGADWECVGEYAWIGAEPGTIPLTVHVSDAFTSVGIPQVAMAASETCLSGENIASGVTDDVGVTKLDLEIRDWTGFDGCWEFAAAPQYLPMILWHRRPIYGQVDDLWLELFPTSVIALVEPLVNQTAQPGTGHVVVTVRDCTNVPAHSVKIASSSAGVEYQVFYSVNGLPSAEAAASDSGRAYFFNVPPGVLNVTATNLESVVVARRTINIRPDYMHEVRLYPRTKKERGN